MELHCKCLGCSFKGKSDALLLSHYRTTHRNDNDFEVPCLYLQCCERFTSESALKKHYDKVHKLESPAAKAATRGGGPSNDDTHQHHDDDEYFNITGRIHPATRPSFQPIATGSWLQPLDSADHSMSTLYVFIYYFIFCLF